MASPSPSEPLVRTEATAIARLAAPLALAQYGLMAISLVDVAVLGHTSAEELGGASIGRAIHFAGTSLGIGVGAALEPLAAQAVGAGDDDDAFAALLSALLACVLAWLPAAALAVGSTWLLAPAGVEPSLIEPARAFLVASVPGMLAFSVFLVAKSFLQAHGRTAAVLSASVFANVVNFPICNVLVRGDEALVAVGLPAIGARPLGSLGAGLASSIAMGLLAAWMVVAAWRARPEGARLPPLRSLPTMKVLRIGAPIGLQILAEVGVFSLAAVLAGRLGSVPSAAHQVAIGLASFTFMGALGISGATSVRVGHAIGEGRPPRRAGLVGIGLGALYMGACAAMFVLARRPLAVLFSDDPAVVELGAQLLGVAAAFQLFDGVQTVSAGALRGAADVRFAFVVNVGAHWLVGLPLALWLGFSMGLGTHGLWIGLLVGLALVASLLLWRFVVVTRRAIARV